LQWASTQILLGVALTMLGERESGTARLEEAVAAYREVLTALRREDAPRVWAFARSNLGDVLRMLGERENDTARLQEAVKLIREAQQELTRERAPLPWAGTQYQLGNALRALGEQERDRERIETAIASLQSALTIAQDAKTEFFVEKIKKDLDRANQALEKLAVAQKASR
jgi:tetratricopeptide (TPR) repeat protein